MTFSDLFSLTLTQAGVPLLSMAVSLLLAEKAIDTKLMVKASRDLISLLTCGPVALWYAADVTFGDSN